MIREYRISKAKTKKKKKKKKKETLVAFFFFETRQSVDEIQETKGGNNCCKTYPAAA